MKFFLMCGGAFVGALIGAGGGHQGSLVFGIAGFLLGWGRWMIGSVFNPISGRRETLFD